MAQGDFNPKRGHAYPDTPERMTAKWLQDVSRRFLAGRDSVSQVDEAVEEWIKVRWPALRYVPDERTKEELAADGVPVEYWPR